MEQQNNADAAVVVDPMAIEPEPPKVPENMMEALKEIAKEKGVTINPDGTVTPAGQQATQEADGQAQTDSQVEQAQTTDSGQDSQTDNGQSTEQEAAKPPVKVPTKFQNPDGSTNEQKVQKSLMNAEEALRKYEAIEKELARKKSEVAKARMGLPTDPNQQVQQNPQAASFEKQLEADVQKFGLGAVMARLFDAAQTAAVEQARAQIDEIKTENQRNRMRNELQDIAKHDPSILTEDGIAELQKIRDLYPWVNQAENPWSASYDVLLAHRVKQERASASVKSPTPKANTAPPTPVSATQRPAVAKAPKQFGSKAELHAYLDTLPPEKQAAFFAEQMGRMGYK